jgi:hypothetical protein
VKSGKRAILKAWLLAALLALPSTGRIVHILEEAHPHTEDGHSHGGHDCESCLLCHFSFSTFTVADSAASDSPIRPAGDEVVARPCTEPRQPGIISYDLRGPPARPIHLS